MNTQRKYAEGTTVTPQKSQSEIVATLRRYGATGFAWGEEDRRALVAFKAHGRQVRFILDLPDVDDRAFRLTETGRARTSAQAVAAYEAEVRRRWRSLALGIKAKLDLVESGVTTFELEFAMHTVMPDGATAAEHVLPAIVTALETGTVPPMLALGPS